MEDSLFRNYDNNNKYVKAPYQGAVAKIGHLEYLYDYLKENLLADWALSDDGYAEGVVVFDTDGLYRNDVEGNTTQPSSNSPANGWTLISGIGTSSYVPPYKVYTALLNQTGGTAPVATVLENTIGTITFSYIAEGNYRVLSSGLFTIGKSLIFTGQNYTDTGTETTYSSPLDVNTMSLETIGGDGSGADGNLINTMVEIRVYE